MHKLTSETLDETRLRKVVDSDTLELGESLFKRGAVDVQGFKETSADCLVTDNRPHQVRIKISDNFLYLKCDCHHATRGLVCEHEVAAWLGILSFLQGQQPPIWRKQVQRMVGLVQSPPSSLRSKPYLLLFSLQTDSVTDHNKWRVVPYQLFQDALPKKFQSIPALKVNPASQPSNGPGSNTELPGWIEWLEKKPPNVTIARSPRLSLDPSNCLNSRVDLVLLANLLTELGRKYGRTLGYPGNLSLENVLEIFAEAQGTLFVGKYHQPFQRLVQVTKEQGEFRLELNRDELGLHISAQINLEGNPFPTPFSQLQMIHPDPLWLLADRLLFKLGNPAGIQMLDIFKSGSGLVIPPQDEAEFLDQYLLPLARFFPIEGNAIDWEIIDRQPAPRLYLSENNGELQGQLRFGYGDVELRYRAEPSAQAVLRRPGSNALVQVRRRIVEEEAAYELLGSTSFGLKRLSTPALEGTFKLRNRTHPVNFLLHSIPRLAQSGFEIYGEEGLKVARVNRHTPTISFNISTGIDWFDVQTVVNFGDLQVAIKDIRKAIRKKERYIKLTDGSIGEIPEDWFKRYRHLFSLSQETETGMRVSAHHLALLDQVLEEEDQARADTEYVERRQFLQQLIQQGFQGIQPHPLPAGFAGELRPYQQAGVDWLHYLRDYSFGGCLADDMGLGKTIQTLVFLLSIYAQRPQGLPTSLLVVPRSLLINWQREAARFTPPLRLLEYFDTDRIKDIQAFENADIVITTYGVMLRDISVLHGYTFHYAILDESQVIKNPLSQTAKAARLLQSHHRLVLTGTPIENSTVELWSQFSFLNPGLLGSLDYFRREFGLPIEKKKDDAAASLLRKLVFPFILRRTKDQVAPELPPRTERILYCDMDPSQRKIYLRTRDSYRGMLLSMIEQQGLDNSRMHILEGLLRLRQICNHPALVDEHYHGASGKFELLLETLETLRLEGHKALVFSQFVQMLTLVRKELEERRIPYAYLDGATQNRQEQVDEFQENSQIPFFLISLKAGGLGLNLTAADYVIHIDPWWNPAVEMQASDRTHRIGQDKPVFVFKIIARDSVEEKILQLQERKKNLVDQIITTEASFFKELTAEDIRNLFS